MQFYKSGNELIVQDGWEYAESYTFTKDDYEVFPELTRSTTDWVKMGYKQICYTDVEKMFVEAGFSEVPF